MKLTNVLFAAVAGLFVAATLPLCAQTPKPYGGAGSRPWAVLACQFPDVANTYGIMPADLLATWMSNTIALNGVMVDNSINGLVQEVSGGTINFQGTQAFGWYTLPNPTTFYNAIPYAGAAGDPGAAVANDCIAVAQKNGVNLALFTYVAVYVNDFFPGASGVALPANLPTTSPTASNTIVTNAAGLSSPPLVLHELGHLLSTGGQHTDSAFDPLGKASYVSGVSNPTTVAPEWDASRRELMGFIANVATFSGGTQTYNVSRLTQSYAGLPSAIDVPLPNGAKYVISARTQVGHDALHVYSKPNQYGYDGGNSVPAEGVMIELFTSTDVDAHVQMSNPAGKAASRDALWLTGQTYVDTANGITIAVNNFNSTGNPTAQITVSSGLSGTYKLTPQNAPGSCLDVSGAGTTPGTKVDLWICNGGSNQSFNLVSQGNGLYQIQPSNATGLCLDVLGGATSPGTNVDVWTCNGGSNQQWALISDGGNIYELAPQNASGLRLDVAGGATANGTQIEVWTANGGSNQKWALNK